MRVLAKTIVSRPYACSSDVTDAMITAMARPLTSGRSSSVRAAQKRMTLDALMASARKPSHLFVARTADSALRIKNAISSRSGRIRRSVSSPAIAAVTCSTSSFGTRKRSRSNTVHGAAATT